MLLRAMIIGFVLMCAGVLPTAAGQEAKKGYTSDYLEATVDSLELERPVYWLEMYNIADEWEKVILVFGYGNNGSACETILKLAREDAPFREFRCSSSE